MKRNTSFFIKDIIDSINIVEEWIKSYSFEDFVKDDRTVNAVIRKIEIIGEASKNISKTIREKYPEIP